MRVTFEVFVALYDEGQLRPGASAFTQRFGAQAVAKGGVFSFANKENALRAFEFAKAEDLDPQLFYFFHVEAEELSSAPAFYLAADVEEDILEPGQPQLQFLTNVDLALDLYTDKILVSSRVKDLLETHQVGVQFAPINGMSQSWFRLDELTELGEPIHVPNPVFFSPNENPPGSYAVQSDGRDIITEANIRLLQTQGVAGSGKVRTPTGVVTWRRRVLISGKLLAELARANVRGLTMPPTPLLSEEEAQRL